jgi:hypothetical protein
MPVDRNIPRWRTAVKFIRKSIQRIHLECKFVPMVHFMPRRTNKVYFYLSFLQLSFFVVGFFYSWLFSAVVFFLQLSFFYKWLFFTVGFFTNGFFYSWLFLPVGFFYSWLFLQLDFFCSWLFSAVGFFLQLHFLPIGFFLQLAFFCHVIFYHVSLLSIFLPCVFAEHFFNRVSLLNLTAVRHLGILSTKYLVFFNRVSLLNLTAIRHLEILWT